MLALRPYFPYTSPDTLHLGRGLEFREHGITFVEWLPFSPDLNLIENVWNWMKDYISDKWGDNTKASYAVLRMGRGSLGCSTRELFAGAISYNAC